MPDASRKQELRTDRPTPARMYDYYLGGKDNFAVDREAAEQVLSAAPEVRVLARENRAFLGRAVRSLTAAPPRNADGAAAAANVYTSRATSPAILRTPKEIGAMFDGYDLVEPGLVYLPQWRPDPGSDTTDADSVWMLCAVGRKS